jgi:hypothetical protein
MRFARRASSGYSDTRLNRVYWKVRGGTHKRKPKSKKPGLSTGPFTANL